jgi:hypothetical protein
MAHGTALRIASQIIAVGLLTLGAGNSYVATVAETCTQSAADSVEAGIFTVPLYAVSFWLLLRRPLPPIMVLLMIPAFFGICYDVWWTARFAYEYLVHSIPVCDLVTGEGGFEFDGREPFYLALWAVLSLLGTAGMCVVLIGAVRDIRRRHLGAA